MGVALDPLCGYLLTQICCMYEDENTIRSVLRIYCHMTSYHKSLK